LQTTNRSWLYQVERGATTLWETWEGYKADGSARESHNRYALGSVASFLREYLAGLNPAAPGYRVLNIRLLVGGGLTWARARVQTPYGRATASWSLDGDQMTLEVVVPPSATALIHLGDGRVEQVGAGTPFFSWTHSPAVFLAAGASANWRAQNDTLRKVGAVVQVARAGPCPGRQAV
jgi:alpha-L-rhamnosidase